MDVVVEFWSFNYPHQGTIQLNRVAVASESSGDSSNNINVVYGDTTRNSFADEGALTTTTPAIIVSFKNVIIFNNSQNIYQAYYRTLGSRANSQSLLYSIAVVVGFINKYIKNKILWNVRVDFHHK